METEAQIGHSVAQGREALDGAGDSELLDENLYLLADSSRLGLFPTPAPCPCLLPGEQRGSGAGGQRFCVRGGSPRPSRRQEAPPPPIPCPAVCLQTDRRQGHPAEKD